MSTVRPTSVAFVWHMHQPWYGDARTGRMVLPWVRLHVLKDYLDMVAVAEAHPDCHLTFNLVPSLLLQIQWYVEGRTTDDSREISGRPAADLSPDERRWLLENGFKCNWGRLVEPYPRFRDLLELRGRHLLPHLLDETMGRFTEQDFRDLQVWHNLAWCGWELRTHEPVVRELLAKARGFTEADQQALLTRLDEVVPTVLPRYVAAARAGHLELSTTPLYHPILPLLCDFEAVHAALPNCRLPAGHTSLAEDAAHQLRAGRELCREILGVEPAGLWPSEGSVSVPALALAEEAGFRWAATDEQVLNLSIQHQADPRGRAGRRPEPRDFLQVHRHGHLSLFFRHHRASDRIGFDYATWSAETAVHDLLRLLERTAAHGEGLERPVISVILDGENCWEFYRDNGHDFLDRLYTSLAAHPFLDPVTCSEHLDLAPAPPALDYVFPGSWINHDFYIWAGHREDQRAWELLFLTRQALVDGQAALDEATRRQAWEHLYIAEGSDWYWWYGDDHSSADDAAFDQLFRDHLQRVWELLGQPAPEALEEAICGLPAPSPLTPPVAPFTPVLDGRETTFYEWRAAGRLEGRGAAGAMTRQGAAAEIRGVRFGFDDLHVYLALELTLPAGLPGPWAVELEWTAHGGVCRAVLAEPQLKRAAHTAPLASPIGPVMRVATDSLVEVQVPSAALPAAPGETAELVVTLTQAGETVDRWPGRGTYEFPIPAAGDWLRHWLV